jgi:hypothetical protein
MPRKHKSPDKQQSIELTTDFLGEDRHEFVAKLAYKFWEERGRPLGSPEVDWFAAERAMYAIVTGFGFDCSLSEYATTRSGTDLPVVVRSRTRVLIKNGGSNDDFKSDS